MKKMIYSMMLSLAVVTVKANHQNSDLKLDVYGDTWFTVVLNHQHFGNPQKNYEIKDINPGSHFLQVYEFIRRPFAPPVTRLIFGGYVEVPAASVVKAKIDRWGHLRIVNLMPKCVVPVSFNYYPLPAPAIYPMSNYDFNILRNTVESKSFESTRMQIVKQVLSDRYVTTGQVRQLMDLMWFESSKLELAKFAYNRVVDRNRYFVINDVFSFESSISELDRYIKSYS